MRMLITGAAGFIGSHLMEEFSSDHLVIGVDNFLTGRKENVSDVLELDVLDRHTLYAIANELQPEVIIHCAASYSDPDKWHRDTQTNVEGSINVAIAAKHHSARVIYPQTILPPISSYAISKIAGEQYLRVSDLQLTVLRLANVYGPRNLSGPIPVFYKRITEGLPCVVVDTARDMVFIEDLVSCVRKVVEEEYTGTFDVCSGFMTPIFELFRYVARELGSDESPPIIPPGSDDVQGAVVRFRGIPFWEPKVNLEEGIARTIESYRRREMGDTYTHLRMKE